MKANAPEKIYIALDEINDLVLDCRFDYSICIEYIRTDVVIEKALKWMTMKECIDNLLSVEMIDEFKTYMEKE